MSASLSVYGREPPHYATILYASTLVAVIIAVFKYCHSRTVNSILNGGSAASTKSTIIHGISGLLVICYSECVHISFLLVTPAGLFFTEKQ